MSKRSRYEEFAAVHGHGLVKLAYAICGDRGRAQDAVQPPSASATATSRSILIQEERIMPRARLTARVATFAVVCAVGAAVAIAAAVAAAPTAQGFLGIATELNTIPALAGPASDPDTPLVHLLQNLSSGAPVLLRLGGNSGDDSWWPIPGMKKLPYLYRLTPRWGASVHALLTALSGRAVLGLNLEAGSRIANAEVTDFDRYEGANLIDAFELGNEPEFFSWTQVGQRGRSHDRPRRTTRDLPTTASCSPASIRRSVMLPSPAERAIDGRAA